MLGEGSILRAVGGRLLANDPSADQALRSAFAAAQGGDSRLGTQGVAVPFAGKYRIVGGAGSDSHVARGLGSVRIRMRDFDGPEEFLESLRDADIAGKPSSLRYAQVQALKFLQTRATPPAARRATRRRKVARAVAGRGGQ